MVISMPMRGAKIMGLGIDGNRELVPMRWGADFRPQCPCNGPTHTFPQREATFNRRPDVLHIGRGQRANRWLPTIVLIR
jgi:hypothetical protein